MQRGQFFERIRQQLKRPRLKNAPLRDVVGMPDAVALQPIGSRPPPAEPVLGFKAELERVGGEVRVAENLAEAHAALAAELERWSAERIVTWARPEFEPWQLGWLWNERGARAFLDASLESEEALKRALLDAQVGITCVDYAVAGTGSLVVSASRGRPRGVSLLPTVHIALVRASQIVPRMGAALAGFAAGGALGMPSAVHFITGPSRTSDIENDLTIGVHGPAAVSVIVWRDPPSPKGGES